MTAPAIKPETSFMGSLTGEIRSTLLLLPWQHGNSIPRDASHVRFGAVRLPMAQNNGGRTDIMTRRLWLTGLVLAGAAAVGMPARPRAQALTADDIAAKYVQA